MQYRVAIIGTVGLPAQYGGWESLSEQLVLNLDKTYDMTVYCSAFSYAERPKKFGNAKLVYIKLKANGFQSIPYDIVSMLRAYRESDVMLILGVSGCIALPVIRLLTKKAIIVNIDGFEWKRAKWSPLIKKFLKFSERLAVRFADRIVTDNKVLRDYVLSEYGVDSTLIAYGGDQALKSAVDEEAAVQFDFLNSPYAFSVCRIEPENNIHLILQAFSDNGIPLVLVGNWKQSEYGSELQRRYSAVKNLFLLDPIYDPAKLAPLRSNCTLYVHGHSAGGTNPSLVEAMWLGLPIIAFDVSFNRASTEDKAEYFKFC
ncbi:DUF1972 domain-containing protein [Pseudomonas sp. P8_241]|uniref:DUF1972 domain-containing protein n=1 Tax=Pseudomonas sp. P8_241 TaxID=3043445 RepID=UPI002A367664|nr:DUF1972 domain-containing protein [Pseudomonas sp. P8_241]WPN48582.1 DUF1972 domain-containing protein [Pseudomonas sp. P8_241]